MQVERSWIWDFHSGDCPGIRCLQIRWRSVDVSKEHTASVLRSPACLTLRFWSWSSVFFRNVCELIPDYTTSHPSVIKNSTTFILTEGAGRGRWGHHHHHMCRCQKLERIQQKFASVCLYRFFPHVPCTYTVALEKLSLHSLRKPV
jgi:hypothetical protein